MKMTLKLMKRLNTFHRIELEQLNMYKEKKIGNKKWEQKFNTR